MHPPTRPPRFFGSSVVPAVFAAVTASAWLTLAGCSSVGPVAMAQSPPLSSAQIAELVASPDRSDADRSNDLRRQPEQMLAFVGIRPVMIAVDTSAGGGYTTELLARAQKPGLGHIVAVVRPVETPLPPEVPASALDLATLMFNYHDLGHMGVDRAQMNRAVFAALKPGGVYVIADHAGRPGTGISEAGTLHRIEESFLRAEVEKAGFRWLASGDFLRNPADPRDQNTPNPPQPQDEFVLKFVKP